MGLKPYRFDLMQGWISRRLFPGLFARVEISPDHLKKWRALVAKGVVVPLLDSPSRIDFLALYYLYRQKGGNYPKFPLGISMLPWISIRGWLAHLKAHLLWIVKRRCLFDPFAENEDISTLGRVPFTVYINPADAYVQRCLNFRTTPLKAVVRAQRSSSLPIYLVPHLVIHDVLPQTEKRSLYTAFWGKFSTPKWTLRVKNVLFRKRIQVRLGPPIDVQRVLKQNPGKSDSEIALELRQAAVSILDKKLRGISGPPLPSRRRMVSQILEMPDLWDYLEKRAAEEGKPVEELAKKVKGYVMEIAADLRISYVKVWEKILRWVWQNLYDGVDVNEAMQQRLRRIARNHSLVYIPSHKSHIDYFLLSYVLYKMNLPLPLVAAGTNLSFWPVGPVFRRSSAFFIRRSFRDNLLYGEVFYLYLRELIREGVPIEFFIEGGRSRTGKLILPKKGMIAMIFRALAEESVKDIYVVPTAISYERIVEEEGYIRELRGEEKRKEKKRDLLRIRKIFRKRYGTVFVRFGAPISLKRYLEEKNVAAMPEAVVHRRDLYQKVADDIIRAIQSAMAVTPSSLVAAALLSRVGRGISQSEVVKTAELYRRILEEIGTDIPVKAEEAREAYLRSLGLFTQDGIIRKGVEVDEADPFYFVPPEKRIHLEFSKNMMIAHLAPLSLYAWAARAGRNRGALTPYRAFSFLFHLFRYEFLLPVEHPRRWYRLGQTRLETLDEDEARDLRHLTLSALEGFLVGVSYTVRKMEGREAKEGKVIQEMIRWGKEMLSTGQAHCPESLTSATFQGWLRVALEDGIFEEVQGSGKTPRKRRERGLRAGPNFQKAKEILDTLKDVMA